MNDLVFLFVWFFNLFVGSIIWPFYFGGGGGGFFLPFFVCAYTCAFCHLRNCLVDFCDALTEIILPSFPCLIEICLASQADSMGNPTLPTLVCLC